MTTPVELNCHRCGDHADGPDITDGLGSLRATCRECWCWFQNAERTDEADLP